ncbi:uncharacterized protein [Euwallacea similis]|uniref:uncharacterized protein n=1 Tax=Euwallacea similis TaxID=1736056 RepID=UPI00344BFE71
MVHLNDFHHTRDFNSFYWKNYQLNQWVSNPWNILRYLYFMMGKSKKKPSRPQITLQSLFILSHLGLFMVLASWFLCYTEFYQTCSKTMVKLMKLILVGILMNITVLLFVLNRGRMHTIEQNCTFALALLYTAATFYTYQSAI